MWPETRALGPKEKTPSNLTSKSVVHSFWRDAMSGSELIRTVNSVQYFALTFFSDHLLERLHDLVPSLHYRLNFILGEIVLGFLMQFVPVQRLQFLK